MEARAIRTNPAYAAQQRMQQERDWEMQDRLASRNHLEGIMGQRGQAAIPEQSAPMGGLFDQAMFQDDAPPATTPYDGTGASAQWNEDQSEGLMGAQPAITAQGGAMPSQDVITQQGQQAVAPTGLFGDELDQREVAYRQQMNPLQDVRGYGRDLLKQNLAPPSAGNAFSQKLAMMQTPQGRQTLSQMQDMGVLGGQTINVGDKLRGVEEQAKYDDIMARNKGARTRVEAARTQASEATRGIGDIEYTLDLLNTVNTGTGAELMLAAKKLAEMTGFDVNMEEIGESEALRAKLGDFVMARVAQTKGAVSEKEMELFKQYSANFGNTPEGNKRIINFKKAKSKRDIAVGKMIVDMQRAGESSYDIDLAIDEYIAANSILDTLIDQQNDEWEIVK